MLPSRIARDILVEEKNQAIIKAVSPTIALRLNGIDMTNPIVKKKLGAEFIQQKERQDDKTFIPAEILSCDGKEIQGMVEQIIIYNLFKTIETPAGRNSAAAALFSANLDPESKDFGDLTKGLGLHSFDYMKWLVAEAIKAIENAVSCEALEYRNARNILAVINQRLPFLFRRIGFVMAAMNLLEERGAIKNHPKNTEDPLTMQALRVAALKNLICARELKSNAYSEKVFSIYVPYGNIKNLLSKNQVSASLPDDTDIILAFVENEIKAELAKENYDISIPEKDAKFILAKIIEPSVAPKSNLYKSSGSSATPDPSSSGTSNTQGKTLG